MKKFAPIAAIAVFAIAFTSCKKDYVCSCTGSSIAADIDYTYTKVKKDDAETACNTANTAWQLGGGSCKLK